MKKYIEDNVMKIAYHTRLCRIYYILIEENNRCRQISFLLAEYILGCVINMKLKVEGVSEIVLEVNSMERAINFWSEKFGFPIVEQWGYSDGQFDKDTKNIWATWLYVGGNTRLALWLPRTFTKQELEMKNRPISQWNGLFDEGGIHVHFTLYIQPCNFEHAAQTLKELNIDSKLIENEQIGQKKHRLYFKDTENNVVELYTLNMKEDYLDRLEGKHC